MNAFVRQLAVLSLLWAFCELLMPEGKQQQMVRLTAGVLVMVALVSALNGMLGGAGVMEWPSKPALAEGGPEKEPERFVLQAVANEARRYCERVAQRAGYEAQARVYLRRDGALEKAELHLTVKEGGAPLIDENTLVDKLAQALAAEPSRIQMVITLPVEENITEDGAVSP